MLENTPMSSHELGERLRKESHKLTAPRQAILSVLREWQHPIASREILERLPKGDCNLATIYRSLHLLESMGIVKRFDFGDGVARYELTAPDEAGHHHHLICTGCAAVVKIKACFPSQWEEQIARENGFESVTHKLEFFGTCPRCAVS
jgi:Fur family ferric uptake transcriptional regulator